MSEHSIIPAWPASSVPGHWRRLSDADNIDSQLTSCRPNRPEFTPEDNDDNDAGTQHKSNPNQRLLTYSDYTVGWIAPDFIERAAAIAMLDEVHPRLPRQEGDVNNYSFGRIGDHNTVIVSLPDDGYGIVDSAMIASNLHRTFPSLQVSLVVGIASGAPGLADVRLGDVVVGTKLIRYDLEQVVGEGHHNPTPILLRPALELRMAITALRAQHEIRPSQIPSILRQVAERNPYMEQYAYRGSLYDYLFESTYDHPEAETTCNKCDLSRQVKRASRPNDYPMIHYGVIASGCPVIEHANTRDQLARQLEALCFETEGAGAIENLQCLVVRSICNYADSHKNTQWQRYAAATAAAYAKELLGEIPALET